MVVRMASRTTVVDAPSGFRALSREAALRLHVHGEYTYTLETIIAAGRKNMAVTSVPIRTNPDLRPSRLVQSLPDYVLRSALTILRSFATYKPLRFFVGVGLGAVRGRPAPRPALPLPRSAGEGAGHVQSVIMSALLISMGVFTGLIGIVADLIAVNRRLLEKLLVGSSPPRSPSAAPGAAHRPAAASRAPPRSRAGPVPSEPGAQTMSASLPAARRDDHRRQRLSQVHDAQSAGAPAGHQLHRHAPSPGPAHRRARRSTRSAAARAI